MKDSVTVQISEGLGNQLFMYANAYAFSKNYSKKLLIDDTSGYFRNKNKLRGQKYLLDYFNINNNLAPNNLKFDNFYKHIKKKILINIDNFKTKKSFLIESSLFNKSSKEITGLKKFDNIIFSDNVFLNGNFENQSYFINYKDDLINLFTIKDHFVKDNTKLMDQIQNSNSVSIHVRQNRFSDQNLIINNKNNIKKSNEFTDQTLSYIDRSINFFNSNFENITFFVWSNNFDNLESFFSKYNNKFIFIKNNDTINDFNLFKYSKHFIVSPSTYHWWGSWLNNNKGKVSTRPKNINPSNNKNFWPDEWIEI
tara:strand:- start:507 stop:1436 length:930 start_codon:yes stop_codon:yes gene_type:complete